MVAEKLKNRFSVNRQNSFFGFLVAGVIGLVLLGIAGFYWFVGRSPAHLVASRSQPGAAIFVSKLAPVMVSLLVNPEKLQKLDTQGELAEIKHNLFEKSNIDYQEDIRPWLGNEITLAVTSKDLDRNTENGFQSGYLMALATEKPEKSREFLELLFSKRALLGAKLEVEQYQGIKIIYDNHQVAAGAKNQNTLAGAVVDNFVLFANDPKVLREAINNLQAPDLNLTSSRKYQKATEQLPEHAVAVAFLNLPMVAQWQGLKLSAATYDSEIMGLVLNPQGLLAETTFLAPTKAESSAPLLAQPIAAWRYIPESAGVAVAGVNLTNLETSNLAKLWKQGTSTLYGTGEDALGRLAQPLVEIQKRWGLNFNQDIFSWVTGEYAIALLPHTNNSLPSWVFVVEKSPQLEAGIVNLDKIASQNGLNVNSLTLNNHQILAWTELTTAKQKQAPLSVETKIRGAHTSLDNYEIFASDLEIMNQILATPAKSVLDNPNFQKGIAAIPQPNQGYVYLDWQKSQGLLEKQIPLLKFVEVLGKPLFHKLRSLTVSSYGSETGILKGGVFFQLNP
ncbi:hypothetical protein B6N60_03971 [Richelia sinica FACHB-800]|uniref:DUF3352 domain-containing protein n=1 Tax=Richelia sinica FACHB-800 TaxID=1357546 RepID=A0A975Y6G5_9NOST|nr:DUF3352 domain-containing protein [Richelia sinica]QXE25257.1 hypothetical protein B6N60_03971 [Richelia sinica FACHB-800]